MTHWNPHARAFVLGTALLSLSAGCDPHPAVVPQPASQAPPPASAEPAVRVVHPERKTVRQPIEQPGFNIEAFQETPLYARITGYVRKWNVDIGDHVRKDDVLAELTVPEMEVDLRQKEAAVRQAAAEVGQARAAVLTAKAREERTKSQYERMTKVAKSGVVDQENLDETRLGYDAAKAASAEAAAAVTAAEARAEVASAHRDYAATMLQYARIRSPYDGVVTRRHVNTGDFVQPAGTGTKGQPLYVVSQLDPARVFVNVPGTAAALVKDGDPVVLRLQGAGGQEFQGKVTRNARSLDPQARTLRTEIDLPNLENNLLPGMYVQATISVQHPNTWTLPAAAVVTEGDRTFYCGVQSGKVVRVSVQVGLRGGGLVEVLKKQERSSSPGEADRWVDFTGDEAVVAGSPAPLTEGQAVRETAAEK
jgi:multidrug efflux pump subunit AcrA (membrane-fusion protein)